MLTLPHFFRNRQKLSPSLEYFVDNKPNKGLFVQFRKFIGPPFLLDACQNEVTCAVL